jgi:transcriptional regulator with XRE-family HTH domain
MARKGRRTITGSRLEELRARAALTIERMAERCGCPSHSTYLSWTRSRDPVEPRASNLRVIADAFGVTTDWLLGRVNERKYPVQNRDDEELEFDLAEAVQRVLTRDFPPDIAADGEPRVWAVSGRRALQAAIDALSRDAERFIAIEREGFKKVLEIRALNDIAKTLMRRTNAIGLVTDEDRATITKLRDLTESMIADLEQGIANNPRRSLPLRLVSASYVESVTSKMIAARDESTRRMFRAILYPSVEGNSEAQANEKTATKVLKSPSLRTARDKT